jgi:hypothetical protein
MRYILAFFVSGEKVWGISGSCGDGVSYSPSSFLILLTKSCVTPTVAAMEVSSNCNIFIMLVMASRSYASLCSALNFSKAISRPLSETLFYKGYLFRYQNVKAYSGKL